MVRRTWCGLAGLFAVLMAGPAWAQGDAGAAASADGGAHHGPSAGRRAVVRAQTALTSRDFSAAQTAYREASNENDTAVEGLLGLGYTAQLQGDRDAALAAYRQAADRASTAGHDLHRARALQSIATLYEEMGRWAEALTAWEAFVSFAEGHSSVANAANGRARVDVIRQRATREPQDQAVRHRIEERQRVNARGPQG